MPIPGARVSWFRDLDVQLLCYDVLKAAGALAIAWIAVPRLSAEGRPQAAVLTLIGAGTICVGSVLSAIATLRQKRKKASLHDLEGCLQTLHAVLHAAGEDPPTENDPGVRVTIHVPRKGKKGSESLEQVCDYICRDPSRASGKGRTFSPNTGLIGEVYRLNRIGVVERLDPSYESFIEDMMNRWGYTKAEAQKLDGTVMSNMAVPLASPERGVEAVVYIDSRRRKFFTKTRQDLVEGAGLGIALFVGRRYN